MYQDIDLCHAIQEHAFEKERIISAKKRIFVLHASIMVSEMLLLFWVEREKYARKRWESPINVILELVL